MKGVIFLCLILAAATTSLSIQKPAQTSLRATCMPTWGADAPINNLVKSSKVVDITITTDCYGVMEIGRVVNDPNIRYNPRGNTCNIGFSTDSHRKNEEVKVYAEGEKVKYLKPCIRDENTVAFALPQDDNKNTYMILDSGQASWFFTAVLGGCDIFIATRKSVANDKKPLIVHGNANAIKDPTANLDAKGKRADDIIRAHVAEGYQLRARVYLIHDGVDKYWNDYKRDHSGVRLYGYSTSVPTRQAFNFFAHYEAKRGVWRYYIKAAKTGLVTEVTL